MSASPSPLPPLIAHLPATADPDAILNGFLEAVLGRGLELYPAQEEAILEIVQGKHLILNTPTGSGKSLVAEALHFKALAEGKRSVYTAPIKALVSEKFFALCDQFGADRVGMMTGDASINRDAPILCCTAEILSNLALREGAAVPFDAVVIDEFHYYGDRDRGVAWQVPLLLLTRASFVLMSATLGDVLDIQRSLEKRTGRAVAVVRSFDRPVPLDFEYRETFVHESIEELIESHRAPVYIVHFTQRDAAEQAQALTSAKLVDKEAKQAITQALYGHRFDTPYGKDVRKYAVAGIGLHHAGLLPKYRLLVEKLAQDGLLKVICGTDTLGVGVNIPIRTVLFSKLCKFDGEKTGILSVRDFKQIAGRAGRKGFDEQGWVVVQAPEHVVENRRLEDKVARGGLKRTKVVKKKPPERNFVAWDEGTFKRLIEQPPEALRSQFQVGHGMLLNLLQGGAEQDRNGYRDLVALIDCCHDTDHQKRQHRRRAAQLFRSLVQGGIVSVVRNRDSGNRVVVNADLQRDFSLNHTLSLFLLDALPRLDHASESYALDVMSLCESILESPRVVLQKQVDKLFVERLAELKAQGMEYDQRMEELQKLEHPKPLGEFIYDTFNAFAGKHPWVGHEDIRPKSIARELYERCLRFHDYVGEYGLQRSEGVLLRYLSDAYKTLVQNVPESARDEGVLDILATLRTLLAEVDSSLLREWEQLLEPTQQVLPDAEREARLRRRQLFDPDVNPRAFAARVRAELHRLVASLAARDLEAALAACLPEDGDPWDAARLDSTLRVFFDEHTSLVYNHAARLPEHTTLVQDGPRQWTARQVLLDGDGPTDWMIECQIDVSAERDVDQPLIQLLRIGV
ncbi:MAG: DUF3516 domain-containing protein [Pseudomonadota bacterium]